MNVVKTSPKGYLVVLEVDKCDRINLDPQDSNSSKCKTRSLNHCAEYIQSGEKTTMQIPLNLCSPLDLGRKLNAQ